MSASSDQLRDMVTARVREELDCYVGKSPVTSEDIRFIRDRISSVLRDFSSGSIGALGVTVVEPSPDELVVREVMEEPIDKIMLQITMPMEYIFMTAKVGSVKF